MMNQEPMTDKQLRMIVDIYLADREFALDTHAKMQKIKDAVAVLVSMKTNWLKAEALRK